MIETILALAQICKIAIDGGNKVIEKWNKMRLSDTQEELMIAASNNGEIYYISVDGGDWLRIGTQSFPQDITGDPMITAKYLDAFKKLCESGYITYDRGCLFKLTSDGFERARKLAG
jgi:hypothetical protein